MAKAIIVNRGKEYMQFDTVRSAAMFLGTTINTLLYRIDLGKLEFKDGWTIDTERTFEAWKEHAYRYKVGRETKEQYICKVEGILSIKEIADELNISTKEVRDIYDEIISKRLCKIG